jgi:hypothetical protein
MSTDEPTNIFGTILGTANAIVRGIANGVTLGLADKAEAATEASLGRGSYDDRLKVEDATDRAGGSVYNASVVVGAVLPLAKFLKAAQVAKAAIMGGGLEQAGKFGSASLEKIASRLGSAEGDISRQLQSMATESRAELEHAVQEVTKFMSAHPGVVSKLIDGAAAAKGVALAGISTYVNFHDGHAEIKPPDVPASGASDKANTNSR